MKKVDMIAKINEVKEFFNDLRSHHYREWHDMELDLRLPSKFWMDEDDLHVMIEKEYPVALWKFLKGETDEEWLRNQVDWYLENERESFEENLKDVSTSGMWMTDDDIKMYKKRLRKKLTPEVRASIKRCLDQQGMLRVMHELIDPKKVSVGKYLFLEWQYDMERVCEELIDEIETDASDRHWSLQEIRTRTKNLSRQMNGVIDFQKFVDDCVEGMDVREEIKFRLDELVESDFPGGWEPKNFFNLPQDPDLYEEPDMECGCGLDPEQLNLVSKTYNIMELEAV